MNKNLHANYVLAIISKLRSVVLNEYIPKKRNYNFFDLVIYELIKAIIIL
jgi:hypothetical protein